MAFVNSIVDFLKTGKIKDTLSTAEQEEVKKAAQIYYIECKCGCAECFLRVHI